MWFVDADTCKALYQTSVDYSHNPWAKFVATSFVVNVCVCVHLFSQSLVRALYPCEYDHYD